MTTPMKGRWVHLAAALVLAAGVAGCAPDSGTVTSREWDPPGRCIAYKGNGQCNMRSTGEYRVCVKSETGETGCGQVDIDEYNRCKPRAMWPDCKAAKP